MASRRPVSRGSRWLLGAISLLALILVLDSTISVDFAFSSGRGAARLITIGSAVAIPILLAAGLFYPTAGRANAGVTDNVETSRAAAETEEDRAVDEALDELLGTRGLHRDPDLTLSRLARRLGLPARTVSTAVNRVRGLNVSQFVNEHRIACAAEAIAEVMQAAGFRTKSNFNREFKRVTGESPMDYRRQHRG